MHPPVAKIAFLIRDLTGGGAEKVALSLMAGFVRRGHEVDLLLMKRVGAHANSVPNGVRIIDLDVGRVRSAVTPIVKYLRRERPAALQASMWPLTAAAVFAARLARVSTRIVISDHAMLSRQYAGNRLIMAALKLTARLFYPLAARRIAVSKGCAEDVAALAALPVSAIDVVHNPVPVLRVADEEEILQAASAWHGSRHRLLSVGNLKLEKNQALLLHALARLDPAIDARLLILGEGALRFELEKLAQQLGLSDRAIFAGFVADPAAYYQAATMFVLSSNHEGFGNVLVEALHAGLPIVTTDCPTGPAEALDGGRFGTLVPCDDPEALAKAIEGAVSRKVDAQALRARAADFSESAATDRYLELMLPPEASSRDKSVNGSEGTRFDDE